MESGGDMEPAVVTAVAEAGFPALPTDPDAYCVLDMSPVGVGQMTTFVLQEGAGPAPQLKPAVVQTLSALVGAGPEPAAAAAAAGHVTVVGQTQAQPPRHSHCLVCNAQPDGLSETYALFDGSLYTTTSRSPVLSTLEAAVQAALDPLLAHSQVICAACYDLADRLDQLQEELRQAREAVRRLYWHTAGMYPARPPSPPQAKTPLPEPSAPHQVTPPPQETHPAKTSRPPEPPPSPAAGLESSGPSPPPAGPTRRRPQRAASLRSPGHYRAMAEGDADPPTKQEPEPLAPDQCRELDIEFHVDTGPTRHDKRDERHTCRYCSKTFQRPARRIAHEATHTGQPPTANQCQVCSKTFSQKYYLKEHVKQVHERRGVHSCPTCDKVFMRRLHLDDHMRTHSGERPYTCNVCGRGFSQRGNLRSHSLVHTDEFPYQCDSCGKRLRTRQAFEGHQRKHNDDKPFGCDVCPAAFLLKRSLERHQRKHSGARPFKCPHCERAFRDRGDLRSHLGVHSVQRAHICPLCGLGFTRRYKMVKHLRAKHDRSGEQVQELCLLQQTAHHLLHSQQGKVEPDEPAAELPEPAGETVTAAQHRSPPLLILGTSPARLILGTSPVPGD